MSTLIRNGTVVTARQHLCRRRADRRRNASKKSAPGIAADGRASIIDAAGMYVLPGGIDVHTHLDMPFGGTTSRRRFRNRHARRRFRRHHHASSTSPSRPSGTRMRDALDTWWKKAEGNACIDYGLHMIVTDLGDVPGSKTWTTWCDEGVASFKLFMAYPNVLMVDDATIFKALSQTAKNGALICMHAENGSVIDVIVAARAGRGQDRADLPRAHAAAARRSGSRAPRHRAGGDRGRAGVHRASLVGGRAESGARGPRPRRSRVRRDLPAISAALDRRTGAARISKAPSTSSRRRCATKSICRNFGTD